jgi:hypothetical protein
VWHLALVLAVHPAPVDPNYPHVRLEDAHQFGIDPYACRRVWLDSRSHPERMRMTVAGGWNNPPETCARWEAECEWRERCWYLLDDALYANLPLSSKLNSLERLRVLLGDSVPVLPVKEAT